MSTKRYELESQQLSPISKQNLKLLYISSAKFGGDWHSTMHTHHCTELFYVVAGEGQFKIQDNIYPVMAHDMVVVNPNVEHTEVSYDTKPLEYIVMGIEGLEFASDTEKVTQYGIVNFNYDHEEVLQFLQAILREIRDKSAHHEIICHHLVEILILRLMRKTGFSPVPPKSHASKECATVRRYIDAHFKENINLDQLAVISHLNKYHMAHSFTNDYGISPINYLISRRIEESKTLLLDTNHTLGHIATMVGFSSPSYFSQSFRRVVGVSPTVYRNETKKELNLEENKQ